jgi:hypothetical protein
MAGYKLCALLASPRVVFLGRQVVKRGCNCCSCAIPARRSCLCWLSWLVAAFSALAQACVHCGWQAVVRGQQRCRRLPAAADPCVCVFGWVLTTVFGQCLCAAGFCEWSVAWEAKHASLPSDAYHQVYKRSAGCACFAASSFLSRVWVESTQREEQTNWMCCVAAACVGWTRLFSTCWCYCNKSFCI